MKDFLNQRIGHYFNVIVQRRILFFSLCFVFLGVNVQSQNCTVNAGIPRVFCANEVATLFGAVQGLPLSGTLMWTQISGPSVIIDNPGSLTTTISGVEGGEMYGFRLISRCTDGSLVFDDVIYSILETPEVSVGSNVFGCPGIYNISGSVPLMDEIGLWTVSGPNAGIIINNPNDPNTTITLEPGAGGTTTLRWTVFNTVTNCSEFDEITVTNCGGVEPVSAGPDQTLGDCFTVFSVANLNATPAGFSGCGQMGSWTVVTGPNIPNISNPSSNTTSVTELIEGTYTFRWTVDGVCASGSDEVEIVVPMPLGAGTNASIQSGGGVFCDMRTSTVLYGAVPIFANEEVQWVQTGGPMGAIIESPNDPVTVVSMLDGMSTYTFNYSITNTVTGCSSGANVTIGYGIPPVMQINMDSILLSCNQNFADIHFTTSGAGTTSWRFITGPGIGSPTSYSTVGTSPFTVTGLVQTGTYIVELRRSTNTGNGCSVSTDLVPITVSGLATLANAGTDQLLACNVSSTELAGNDPLLGGGEGIGTWTQVSGPNIAIIDDIHAFDTPISNLISGLYRFRWVISNGPFCPPNQDDVIVRVADAIPDMVDAGTDIMACYDTPIHLSGNIPALNETGEWTVIPNTGIVFSPSANVHDPVVTGLVANTVYTFTWTISNACGEASDDVIITTGNTQGPTGADAGSDQCLDTGTTSTVLNANTPVVGVGEWLFVSGPNIPNINSPNSNMTSVTGMMMDGVYLFEWSISVMGCEPNRDTIEVVISSAVTIANAGPDQFICGTETTLDANSPVTGMGMWTQAFGPRGYTITDLNDPISDITNLTDGVYGFVWTISTGSEGNCLSSKDTVVLYVSIPPTIPDAGSDEIYCGVSSFMLEANVVNDGFWSVVSGPNIPNITPVNSPTATVSNIFMGTYRLVWNSYSGPFCLIERDTVEITVIPFANAGPNQNFCEIIPSFNLMGNTSSTGTWTQISGPNTADISPNSDNTAIVTNLIAGMYTFQYEIDTLGCTSSDIMNLNLFEAPTVGIAGLDQEHCESTSFILSANTPTFGIGTWTIDFGNPSGTFIPDANDPNATYDGASPGVYIFRWTIANGGCSTSDLLRIDNWGAPTIPAPMSDILDVCSDFVQLNGTQPVTGTGNWTIVSTPMGAPTPTILNPILYNTIVTDLVTGTYVFEWTISNGPICPSVSEMVTVEVEEQPLSALAGADQFLCQATMTNLNGNTPDIGETGMWTQISGPAANIVTPSDPGTEIITLLPGTMVFRWTITLGICESFDEVTIVNYETPPVADAGSNFTICNFEPLFLSANDPSPGVGQWSFISGPSTPNILNPNNPNTQVIATILGTYTFRWTISNGTCPVTTSDIEVMITGLPNQAQILMGGNQNICDDPMGTASVSLLANEPDMGVTGMWSLIPSLSAGTADITNPASYNTAFADNFSVVGSPAVYTFQWELSIGGSCPSRDTVVVNIWELPSLADAGMDDEFCSGAGGSFSLNATTPLVGTGIWTKLSGPSATIVSPGSPGTNITGAGVGAFVFRWNVSNGPACPPNGDNVTIINYAPIMVTVASQTICDGGNTTMTSVVSGGSGNFNYQWQEATIDCSGTWQDIFGETTSTYITPTLTTGDVRYYRVIVSESDISLPCPAVTSDCATVTAVPDPNITMNPSNLSICRGGSASFSVMAQGGIPSLIYQWQYFNPGTMTWVNVVNGTPTGINYTNSTSQTLNITTNNTSAALGDLQFRARVSATGNGCDEAFSDPGILSIYADPTINGQPVGATICTGGMHTMSVMATGNVPPGTLNYQWQISTTGTGGWTNVGTNNTEYTTAVLTATRFYRVMVTQTNSGCSTTSAVAQVMVVPDPSISTQPMSQAICDGGDVTLSVIASGGTPSLNYQWQMSTISDTGPWSDVGTDQNTYNTGVLVETAFYQVIVSAGGSGCDPITSSVATITVVPDPNITGQPIGGSICRGGSFTMSVTAEDGTPFLNYQWQYFNPGTMMWEIVMNGLPTGVMYMNTTSPILDISTDNTTAALGTHEYRVVVSASGEGCDDANSDIATLTIYEDPEIGVQPLGAEICSGGTHTMSVTATGNVPPGTLSYLWQFREPPSMTWLDASGINDELEYTTPGLDTNTQYRVIVSQTESGCETISDEIDVIVNPFPFITSASNITICSGQNVGYTPTANVPGTTFTWTAENTVGTVSGFTPAGSGSIMDVLTNAGPADGIVVYTITPQGPAPSDCEGADFLLAVHVINCNPVIGLAKNLTQIINNGNGSYDISFELLVRNYGNILLTEITVQDDLEDVFSSSCSYEVLSLTASGFSINPLYNGDTDTELLLTGTPGALANQLTPGEERSIFLTIRLSECSGPGPYLNTATTEANSIGGPVDDDSVNGTDPDPDGDEDPTNDDSPTPVTLTEDPYLGLAKRLVSTPQNNSDGTHTLTFEIRAVNRGNVDILNFQIEDVLRDVFNATCPYEVTGVTSSEFAVNNAFDGDTDTLLLLPGQVLKSWNQGSVLLTLMAGPCSSFDELENSALATGNSPLGMMLSDTSQNGSEPDPLGSGDPTTQNEPAPFQFSENPVIGLAKRVVSNQLNPDATFNLTFEINIENYGDVILDGIQVVDSLVVTFPGSCLFEVTSITSDDFIVNPYFSQDTTSSVFDWDLLSGNNSLMPGDKGAIIFTMNISTCDSLGTFLNTALITANAPNGTEVSDSSHWGSDPDPDGNGTPELFNRPTPIDFLLDTVGIGLAKNLTGVLSNPDGSFDVSFEFIVRNYGDVHLEFIQVTDDLSIAFPDCDFELISLTSSGFSVNNAFDGNGNNDLLTGYNFLPVNGSESILLTVRVSDCADYNIMFENNAEASGAVVGTMGAFGVTDASVNGTDPDPNGDGNPIEASPTPVSFDLDEVYLGLAKRLTGPVQNLGDGTYRISFEIRAVNRGTININDLQITDNLASVFDMCDFNVESLTSDIFTINGNYNGSSDIDLLGEGNILKSWQNGTVLLTVIAGPCSSLGTLENQASGEGTALGMTITDDSQDGSEPDPDGTGDPTDQNDPTPFTLEENPIIGAAKQLVNIVNKGDGTYDVTFNIRVQNYGDVDLNDIAIEENLNTSFGISNYEVISISSSEFTVDEMFDGIMTTELLLSGNNLDVGQSGSVTLVVNVKSLGMYFNSVMVTANTPSMGMVDDISHSGTDPDPGGMNMPGNFNEPTQVNLEENPLVGIAKRLVQVAPQTDGSYNVTYELRVGNYGDVILTQIQVVDDLMATFMGCVVSVESLTSSRFAVNDLYGTMGIWQLLNGTDTLQAGEIGSILLTLNVDIAVCMNLGPFNNSATAMAMSPGMLPVTDESVNGSEPDADMDGDPTNDNSPTPVDFTEEPYLGLAKRLVYNINNGDGTYDLQFEIRAVNRSIVPLSDLQIWDNVSMAFSGNCIFELISLTSEEFAVNTAYDGEMNTQLLANNITLNAWDMGAVILTVRVGPCNSLGMYTNTAFAQGTPPSGSMIFDMSEDGSEPDPDGTGDPTDQNDPTPFTLEENPIIGAAKQLVNIVNKGDGTYDVTFDIRFQNYGDVILENIETMENLNAAFFNMMNFEVISISSSQFSVNTSFDGNSDTELLLPGNNLPVGQSGTVTLVVNVKSPGVYQNSVFVSASTPNNGNTMDMSHEGTDPDPGGMDMPNMSNTPTEVNLTETPIIGVAKRVASVLNEPNGTYTVTYEIRVGNYGNTQLNGVQVEDNLMMTFMACDIEVTSITSSRFAVNDQYGTMGIWQLLNGSDTLQVGEIGSILLTLNVDITDCMQLGPFNNMASAMAVSPGMMPVFDESVNGSDPDPDGDGDPSEFSSTPLEFTEEPYLGLAKRLVYNINNGDGTYDLQFEIRAVNRGSVLLNNLQITDELFSVFGFNCSYELVSLTSEEFAVNPGYDGDGTPQLLSMDNTLMPWDEGAVLLTVKVGPCNNLANMFMNTATAMAQTPGGMMISDESQDGSEPDPAGTGDPTMQNEPTNIMLEENPLIGASKQLVSLTQDPSDGSYLAVFNIRVVNYGDIVLHEVQVRDDLEYAFLNTDNFEIQYITSVDFAVNEIFDGIPFSQDQMLQAGQSLLPGASGSIFLGVKIFNSGNYENTAIASGTTPTGEEIMDVSHNGSNPDPGGMDMPQDYSDPTPIDIFCSINIVCPENIIVNTDPDVCTWTSGEIALLDTLANCDVNVEYSITDEDDLMIFNGSGNINNFPFPVGINQVCFTASSFPDAEGQCCFTVTVIDAEAPQIINPICDNTFNYTTAPGECFATDMGDLGDHVLDNCTALEDIIYKLTIINPDGSITVLNERIVEYQIQVGISTVIFSFTDESGNETSCTSTAVVVDDELPLIDCASGPFTRQNDPGLCGYTVQGGEFDPQGFGDNCPGAIISHNYGDWAIENSLAGATFPVGTTNVVWTVTDASGNTATCAIEIMVLDIELPEFVNCPANVTFTLGADADCETGVIWSIPVAMDNCGNVTVTQTLGPTLGTPLAPGIYNIQYTATDGATPGNTAVCNFTVEVVDDSDPLLLCLQNMTFSTDPGTCSWTSADNQLNPVLSVDNCPSFTLEYSINGDMFQMGVVPGGTVFGPGMNTVTYRLSDGASPANQVECSFTVTVGDDEVPAINPMFCNTGFFIYAPEMDCNTTFGIMDSLMGNPLALDNCTDPNDIVNTFQIFSSDGQVYFYPDLISVNFHIYSLGLHNVHITSTDASGNSSTCEFQITVRDTIAPVFDCSLYDDVMLETDPGECYARYEWMPPQFTDNCPNEGGLLDILYAVVNPDGTTTGPHIAVNVFPISYNFHPGISTVIMAMFDDSENMIICMFDVTVVDNEAPVFLNCPQDTTFTVGLFSNDCEGGAIWSIPVASDNCEVVEVRQVGGPGQGSLLAVGEYIIRYVAEDVSGNISDTCSFTINVIDTEEPVLVCPGNQLEFSTDPGTCNWQSTPGSLTPLLAGSNCPADLAWDVVNPDGTMDTGSDDVSGFVFQSGVSIITYTITEIASGQSRSCSFTITINDREAPQIECMDDIIAPTMVDCTAEISLTLPGVSDNCSETEDLNITYTVYGPDNSIDGPFDDDNLDFIFQVGINQVVWQVTDEAGNSQTCTQSVTVNDVFIPEIILTDPDTLILSCNQFGPTLDPTVIINEWLDVLVAIGNCDPSPVVTYEFDRNQIDMCVSDTLTVTWTATDIFGNTSTAVSAIVILADDTTPEVVCPDAAMGITRLIDCMGDISWDHPVATDGCGISIYTYTIIESNGTVSGPFDIRSVLSSTEPVTTQYSFGEGTSFVRYYVEDHCGNVTECEFEVFVGDIVAPYFANCPADIFVGNDVDQCSAKVNWSTPVAFDNCNLPAHQTLVTPPYLTISRLTGTIEGIEYSNYESGDEIPVGTWQIGYVVEDEQGLTDTCRFSITVWDTQLPTLNIGFPLDITLDCSENWDTFQLQAHHIVDNCDRELTIEEQIISTRGDDPMFCSYYQYTDTIIWTVFDGDQMLPDGSTKMNSRSWRQVITWIDTTAPLIILPSDVIVNDCNFGMSGPDFTGYASGIDNCASADALTVEYRDSFEIVCLGQFVGLIHRIWTVTDPCGNRTSSIQKITVFDQNPPELMVTEDVSLYLNERGVVKLDADVMMVSVVNSCLSDPAELEINFFPSLFNCNDLGMQNVLITALDPCSKNTSYYQVTVEVLDTTAPVLNCPDETIVIEVPPGNCTAFMPPLSQLLVYPDCNVRFTSNPPINAGFSIGMHSVEITATDATGNSSSCTITLDVQGEPLDFSNSLACIGEVNVSLNEKCTATLTPDMLLTSTGLCTQFLCLEIEDDKGKEHLNFFDIQDVGKTFKVRVVDCNGGSGNGCWSIVHIESKSLPQVEWPAHVDLTCLEPTDTSYAKVGKPIIKNCKPDATISFSDEFELFDSCNPIAAQIKRTWVVQSGTSALTHIQIINIIPFDLVFLIYPKDVYLKNAFTCDELEELKQQIKWDNLEKQSPIHPDQTGYPTIAGFPVNSNRGLCNYSMKFEDNVFEICDAAFTVVRTWQILNRCAPLSLTNPIEFKQKIDIEDRIGVDFEGCFVDLEVGADPHTCLFEGDLPVPVTIKDGCGVSEFTAYITGGGYLEISGAPGLGNLKIKAKELTLGEHEVTYVAIDECYNVSLCKFKIFVEDRTPPTAIAKEFVVVSLSRDGKDGVAKVYAESINNGSYDTCSDVVVEIRREIDHCGIEGNTEYSRDEEGSSYIKVCCEDLDQIDSQGHPFGIIKVLMRVWDDADGDGVFGSEGDHFSEIWSYVRVEDKSLPIITVPEDQEVTCDVDLDDLEFLGTATLKTLCKVLGVDYADETHLNQCGVGTISRKWYVVGKEHIYGIQTITINALPAFTGEIIFPSDTVVTCLDEIVSGPVFQEGFCAQIAISEQQDTFKNTPDACIKIIRSWTIIDWCAYDQQNPQAGGIWTGSQIVKLMDEDKPQLLSCEDVKIETTGSTCSAGITLFNRASDEGDCPSSTLLWEVFVDIDNDGGYDYEFSSYFKSSNTKFDDSNGNGIPDVYVAPTSNFEEINIQLPVQIESSDRMHRVLWRVSDGCGNTTVCETQFMVSDMKSPTPYCINVSTALMDVNSGGYVEIWAIDFDLGSSDNCTSSDELIFTFDGIGPISHMIDMDHYFKDGGLATQIEYEIGEAQWWQPNLKSSAMRYIGEESCGEHIVMVTVWDEAGNNDFCQVVMNIAGSACTSENGSKAMISGKIHTPLRKDVEGAEVRLISEIPEYSKNAMTGADGKYAFDHNVIGHNYRLNVEKDDDHLNGVSTLDILLILRHILGHDPFEDPYQLIAGDINNDGRLTATDMLILRKLILGIYDSFPGNMSWRFIDASNEPQMGAIWPFTENRMIDKLDNDMLSEDFIAVKIGDVSGDVRANARSKAISTRSDETVQLKMKKTPNGNLAIIAGSNYKDVMGWQMTLKIDRGIYKGIIPGKLDIKPENIASQSGYVRLSYNQDAGEFAEEGDVLFELEGIESVILSDVPMRTEAYIGKEYLIKSILLEEYTSSYALHLKQNHPNPWNSNSVISFTLPVDAYIEIIVRNMSGKEVWKINDHFKQGENSVRIQRDELTASGAFTYELILGDERLVKRMIHVK